MIRKTVAATTALINFVSTLLIIFLFVVFSAAPLTQAEDAGVASLQSLKLIGDWKVQVVAASKTADGKVKETTVAFDVVPPAMISITAEKHDNLPLFNATAPGWVKGAKLAGLQAQECSAKGLLDSKSLVVRSGPQNSDTTFELNKDYAADLDWGTIGRLPDGRIAENQPVYISYQYTPLRIDSIVMTRKGDIVLRNGKPHVAIPVQPVLEEGDRRLANLWLPGPISKLAEMHLYPILESAYPEPPKASPTVAEQLLPKTMQKLRDGTPLRILAWGDSVTAAGYLPDNEHDRWQAQFVARLQKQFPKAKIELVTEAWGGRNTASYLGEPAGSAHNYQEKVLNAKPDLIVSEFVNDAGLNPQQVEERYSKLLNDFTTIGAEWIILTPHYVRPDWMGLAAQREIDNDPRPYVAGLRQFTAKHSVALADASLRYGRLWRQGIPYHTLMSNGINHPTPQGMTIFADSLIALFP
jgi:lysophospholipase L1-like esterase